MDTPPDPRGRTSLPPLPPSQESTGGDADSGRDLVWFDIDLDAVEPYDIWKPESLEWALTVDWAGVNELVRRNLNHFPVNELSTAIRSAERAGLSPSDQEGLASFYEEPIFATPSQISSGGHRITAMRQQGVRWALGVCYRADIGEEPDASVHPLVAYLPESAESSELPGESEQ